MRRLLFVYLLLCGAACMSGQAQEANLVPQMTSNTACSSIACTAGISSASTAFSTTGSGSAWDGFCDNGDSNVPCGQAGLGGWLATTSTGWLCYQFATAQVVTRYDITPWSVDNFPSRSPKTWTFEGSNTSCTASTTTLDTQTAFTSWTVSTPHSFSFSNSTAYIYYRINVSLNGGAGNVGVQRLAMGGKASGQIFSPNYNSMTNTSAPSPFVNANSGDNSGRRGYEVFDGLVGANQYWLTSVSFPVWDSLDTGSGNTHILGSYKVAYISAAVSVDTTFAPKNWTLEGSNDNSTWTILDTQTNQTGWANSEVRTFTPSCTQADRYFRINITANNGNVSNTAVAELQLTEGSASASCGSHGFPSVF